MTEHILLAYGEDIKTRTNPHGNQREFPQGAWVNAHEIAAGVVYKDANVTVTAFTTKHAMESYGYRFDTSDRSIVITGDTAPDPGNDRRVQRLRCPHPRGQYALRARRPSGDVPGLCRDVSYLDGPACRTRRTGQNPNSWFCITPRFRSGRGSTRIFKATPRIPRPKSCSLKCSRAMVARSSSRVTSMFIETAFSRGYIAAHKCESRAR